jgi:hypothetical protein
MTAETALEPDWEYAPLRIPADVSRVSAAVQLSLHAEYGGWELARVLRYADGRRQVLLRRRRRLSQPGPGVLPLPGLVR